MIKLDCYQCGEDFEVEDPVGVVECPNCGFSPEDCDHPIGYRDSETIRDVGENKTIERVICGKCGFPINSKT